MAKKKDEIKVEESKRISEAFLHLEQGKGLSENAAYFIRSLKKYYTRNKRLSEKQVKALFEIADNLSTTSI